MTVAMDSETERRDRRSVLLCILFFVLAFPVGIYMALAIMGRGIASNWALAPYLTCFVLAVVFGVRSRRATGYGLAGMSVLSILIFGMAGQAAVAKARRIQTFEVMQFLGEIEKTTDAMLLRQQPVPSSIPWTPAKPCCDQGVIGRCDLSANKAAWKKAGWDALKFDGPDGQFRYQYRFIRVGDSYHAQARGDIDCDGEFSLWERVIEKGADSKWKVGQYRTERELE